LIEQTMNIQIEATLQRKLAILADAAKYDASCASSGASRRNSRDGKGLGSTTGSGICHAYTPTADAFRFSRCSSRTSASTTALFASIACRATRRARFKIAEIVALTLGFYRRNMIEGLFLSSGIAKSEDHTMEEMVRVAETLRRDHDFRGYVHLKAIAGASQDLMERAGRAAERLSVNVELPVDEALVRLAPQKDALVIRKAMGELRLRLDETKEEKRKTPRTPRFAPAGQSTQVIIGADEAKDRDIIARSASLYASYGLRRVYYSAFSPTASQRLPLPRPPLTCEHRLYQADWLMRYYGFAPEEIVDGASDGMLDLERDPKLAWALRNRALFPIDVNRAPRETLLRVPGLGARVVKRILTARRHVMLRIDDVARLVYSLDAVRPFVVTPDRRPSGLIDSASLVGRLANRGSRQLDLFA
jgi:putative DNA modification/repair radical SAM protein